MEPKIRQTTELKPGMFVELQPAHQDMHPNRYRGVVQRLTHDADNPEARFVHFVPGTGRYLVNGRAEPGRVVESVHTGRCANWLILPPTSIPRPTGNRQVSNAPVCTARWGRRR